MVFSPSLELPKTENEENDNRDAVLQTLTKPGTRLIMPSEETQIRNGEESTRVFDTFRSSGRTKKSSPHEIGFETFGKVFANDLAEKVIEKHKSSFPEGSIFVREKFVKADDLIPETITAMVKRKKGFNSKTNDWEFFTFNGDLRLQKRETKSSCSKCHSQTKETDFVFKTYLK